jgi:uncharacterized membrane protein YfcA
VLQAALTIGVGLVAGVLSGMFGVGGGLVTTPAIRLLLGFPALIALGTPLPVILPTAVAGAASYARRGLADVRAGLIAGAVGSIGSLAGAWLTGLVGGSAIMVATAALILYVAVDMAIHAIRSGIPEPQDVAGAGEADPVEAHAPAGVPATMVAPDPSAAPTGATTRLPLGPLAAIGLASGLYSGFLGLGGGFVIVPLLARWLKMPLKRAVGTSLVAVAVLAVPGTVAHYLLGHIDFALAGWLVLGTVPGALVGARITAAATERHVALGFAIVLAITGVVLAASELMGGRA